MGSSSGPQPNAEELAKMQAEFTVEFLRVNVYFQNLNVENIDEVPKYDVSKKLYTNDTFVT
jgi:hypothetical protein